MHGGNLSKTNTLIFIVIFVVTSGSVFSAPKSKKIIKNETHSVNSIVNSKKLRVFKSDKRLANNIASTYKVAKKGYINKTVVRKLSKDLKKNTTFFIYRKWAQNLNRIVSSKSLINIKKICRDIYYQKSTNPILTKLHHNSKQLCFQNYLDKLGQKRKSYKSLKNEIKYFSEYISLYLSDNNKGELTYLLSRYKNSPSRKRLLSNSLTTYFLENNTTPDQKILRHMHINHELTKYIQIRGLEKNSTQRLLFSEFKALIKDAYKSADGNDDLRVVNRKVKNVINYYNLSVSYLPKSTSSLKLVGLGKSLMRRSYFSPARSVFKSLIKNSNEYKTDATFELLWTYVTQEDYDGALENVIERYNLKKQYSQHSSSKLKFWIAFTLKEENESGHEKILLDIIKKDPVSYYSIISSKFLEESKNQSSNKAYLALLSQNQKKRFFTNLKVDDYTYRALKRLKVWSTVDYKPFIKAETRALSNTYSNEMVRLNASQDKSEIKDFVSFLTAKVLSSTDNQLEVFKVVYRGINNKTLKLDSDILQLLYPMPFWNKIQKYSINVDPIIPLSLIRQESAFNPKARSHVGARGLMQLMPYTARMYKRRLRAKQLESVNLNLSIGNKYFSKLMQQYENNLVYTLSAYNAGEGRVKRWRTKYLTSDSILHNIENIPFSETRKYVKLIFRNIFFYKLINDESAKVKLADSNKPNKIFDIYLGFNQ